RADLEAGMMPHPADPDPDAIERLIAERDHEAVTYEGWEAIDAAETAAGEPHGRPRVKLVRVEDMLEHARVKDSA
ncbi:MAG: hypothetical protein ABR536_06230, partial [Solirubrobacterales bacterium]